MMPDRPIGRSCGKIAPAVAAGALVVLDQGVKLLVVRPLSGVTFPFVEGFLHFYPKVNENLTWGGNFIEPLSLPAVAVFLNMLVIGLYLSGYGFYRASVHEPRPAPTAAFCLGMAGCVSGLADRTLWGGSLDFLQIPGLLIFDLKDCYLVASLVLFVVLALRHQDSVSARAYARYMGERAAKLAAWLRPRRDERG